MHGFLAGEEQCFKAKAALTCRFGKELYRTKWSEKVFKRITSFSVPQHLARKAGPTVGWLCRDRVELLSHVGKWFRIPRFHYMLLLNTTVVYCHLIMYQKQNPERYSSTFMTGTILSGNFLKTLICWQNIRNTPNMLTKFHKDSKYIGWHT